MNSHAATHRNLLPCWPLSIFPCSASPSSCASSASIPRFLLLFIALPYFPRGFSPPLRTCLPYSPHSKRKWKALLDLRAVYCKIRTPARAAAYGVERQKRKGRKESGCRGTDRCREKASILFYFRFPLACIPAWPCCPAR